MPESITLLIVEDETSTRERLSRVVSAQPGWRLHAAAGSLSAGRAGLVGFPQPFVLLTDLGLPDGSGIDLIAEVRRGFPSSDSLVISVLGDERSVLSAIAAGAGGYLLKDASEADMVRAIEQLLHGGAPLSPSIAVHLMRRLQTPARPGAELSSRELELLKLIAKGLTYEEVGQVMGLRYNTVASYAKELYRKLEVHSRSEAVYEAMQMGLVDSR
jgi:DNA-binding NarL/FixJ family response regulator